MPLTIHDLARQHDYWIEVAKKWSKNPEDVVQDAYIKIMRYLDNGKDVNYTYFKTIMRSVAMDSYKKLDPIRFAKSIDGHNCLLSDYKPYDLDKVVLTDNEDKLFNIIVNSNNKDEVQVSNSLGVTKCELRQIKQSLKEKMIWQLEERER